MPLDTSVAALPADGPNLQRARFYREVASAFEFLALYHTLPADAQRELMEAVQGAAASSSTRTTERNQQS